jgi:CheY-like chemotaxis protein
MRMPVMDGWTFAELDRQQPAAHAPIVVITAAHDAADRAQRIGAAAVIPKPFELDELLRTAERCLLLGRLADDETRWE